MARFVARPTSPCKQSVSPGCAGSRGAYVGLSPSAKNVIASLLKRGREAMAMLYTPVAITPCHCHVRCGR